MIHQTLVERIAAELRDLEATIRRAEQSLLGELHTVKQRHREQIAGSLRSYDLEEARRSLRRIARDLDALTGQEGAAPSPRAKDLARKVNGLMNRVTVYGPADALRDAWARLLAEIERPEGTEPAAQREPKFLLHEIDRHCRVVNVDVGSRRLLRAAKAEILRQQEEIARLKGEPAAQREGAAFGETLVAIAEASYPTDEPTADDMREGAAQAPPPQAEERER